jgi:beta-lactamase superfamily II metal-dependent hydrolase
MGSMLLTTHGRIDKLHTQLALLSEAAGDRRGLPGPETLAAVEGYTMLKTDKNGWIELSTDGERMWVQVERRLENSH